MNPLSPHSKTMDKQPETAQLNYSRGSVIDEPMSYPDNWTALPIQVVNSAPLLDTITLPRSQPPSPSITPVDPRLIAS